MVDYDVLKHRFVRLWLPEFRYLFSYVDLSEQYIQNINAQSFTFPVLFVFSKVLSQVPEFWNGGKKLSNFDLFLNFQKLCVFYLGLKNVYAVCVFEVKIIVFLNGLYFLLGIGFEIFLLSLFS